jgi:chromosomal replication initiation ATPase DnaA
MENNYRRIEKIVAKVLGLSGQNIFKHNRTTEFTNARFMFCGVLFEKQIVVNVNEIGRIINRNHSTVLSAIRKHNDLIIVDKHYQRQYKQILDIVDKNILNCESFDLMKLFKRVEIGNTCKPCLIETI